MNTPMVNTNVIAFDLAWYNILGEYSNTLRRKVCDAVLNFAATGEMPALKGVAKLAYQLIANEISKQLAPKDPAVATEEIVEINEIAEEQPSEALEISEVSEVSENSEISEVSETSEISKAFDTKEVRIKDPLLEIAETGILLDAKSTQSPPDILKTMFNPALTRDLAPLHPIKTNRRRLTR